MSVKAYLIKEINLKINDEEIIVEKILEKTPTFNLNKDNKILDIFIKHNCENTTNDLNGEIFVDINTWQEVLNNISNKQYTPNDLKIIRKITNDLKNKEIIFYKCF